MLELFMKKDYLIVLGMTLLVYILLILNPKVVQLKIRNRKYKPCKKCPMKVHPIKFTIVFFILSTILYGLVKSPHVNKLFK